MFDDVLLECTFLLFREACLFRIFQRLFREDPRYRLPLELLVHRVILCSR